MEGQLNTEVKTAGRLKKFRSIWRSITTDKFVLKCIRGYKIPFKELVYQNVSYFSSTTFSTKEINAMTREISKLLKSGAIVKCKAVDGQFLSPFFLVSKPSGDKRFILNLKGFNKFITPSYFKLEDIRTATKLV